MSDEEIKWPSERIAQGGLFHSPKVQYSKETNDLINLLMKESRLSMMVRKKMNYHLRNGDPLPLPEMKRPEHMDDNEATALVIMRNARNARRKTYDEIKASGAYDQPRYRTIPNLREPTEVAKLKLQQKMSGMKIIPTTLGTKRRPRINLEKKVVNPSDQVNEILDEINERAEWLAEMEEIGEGRNYRDMIHGQIAEKLRHIRELERKIDETERVNKNKEMEVIFSNSTS